MVISYYVGNHFFHLLHDITMAKLSLIKTDDNLENKGQWFDWELGVQLKIARAGNRAFDTMMQELSKPHIQKNRDGNMDDETSEEILKKCIAKTILLGWKNIEDDDGKPLKYSAKNALELLQDEGLRDLYKFVLIKSNDVANYRRKLDEDAVKN